MGLPKYFMNVSQPKPVTGSVNINFAANMRIPLEEVVSKLTQSSTDDKEFTKLVADYYIEIIDDIYMKRETGQCSICTQLFTDSRFVLTLTQIISTVQVPETLRWRLNKMCFDYLLIEDQESYMVSVLMALSKMTNRDKIPALCVIPLPEDIATLLALARYSSDKDTINVKRLNEIIMMQNPAIMTEQMIVDIYLALFTNVLPLFIGVMLDVASPQMLNERTGELYGIISLAILDILNELPIEDIKRGLVLFSEERRIRYSNHPIRFNIESFAPDDYPRIYEALIQLRTEGSYILLH